MWNAIVNAFGWVLMQLHELTSNYGVAMILFTLLTKLILLPFSMRSRKSIMKMTKFTPKMKELEAKFANDKEKYNLELQKLYKQEKVNPLSGCIWTLIPFPLLIALYSVVRLPLSHMLMLSADQVSSLAEFFSVDAALLRQSEMTLAATLSSNIDAARAAFPEFASRLLPLNYNFLGLDLAAVPNWQLLNVYFLLPIVSALVAWLNTWVMQKMQNTPPDQQQNNKFMTAIGPIISLWIGFSMPSAMSFYWTISAIFGMIQEVLLTIYYRKKLGILSPAEQKAEEERIKAEEDQRERERAERRAKLAEGAAPQRGAMSSKKYRQLKAQQASSKALPKKSDDPWDTPDSEPKSGSDSDAR